MPDTDKDQLYVDNLPAGMTQEKFTELFEGFGEVADCRFLESRRGAQTGYGFVSFVDTSVHASVVEKMNKHVIDDVSIRVVISKTDNSPVSTTHVYVGRLPSSFKDAELRALFETYGEIVDLSLIANSQPDKGIGFVHFAKPEEAKKAVETVNETIPTGGTVPLQVKFARDTLAKKARKQGRSSEICTFFQRGNCSRGNDCQFSHGPGGNYGGNRNMEGNFGRYDTFGGGFGAPGYGGGGWANQRGGFGQPWQQQPGAGYGPMRGQGAGGRFNPGPYARTSMPRNQPFSEESPTNVYFCAVPNNWDEQFFRQMCEKFGQIEKVTILTKPDSAPEQGVAFVHFLYPKSASTCVEELNKSVPEGATAAITVRFATKRRMGGGGQFSTNAPSTGNSNKPTGKVNEPCKFFQKDGKCARGSACFYLHEGGVNVPSTQQGFQNQAFNQQYPQQTQGFQYAPQTQGYPGQANQFPDQGFQVGQTYPNQQTGFMSQGYSNQQGVGAEQGYAAPQSYPDGYQAANYQNQFGNQVGF